MASVIQPFHAAHIHATDDGAGIGRQLSLVMLTVLLVPVSRYEISRSAGGGRIAGRLAQPQCLQGQGGD